MYGTTECWTVRTAVAEALPRLKKDKPNSYKTWAPYLELLADGLAELCPCPCPACATGACRCAAGPDGHDPACTPPKDEPDLDCGHRYTGCPDKPITDVDADDIADGGWWCERRGLKRTVQRNIRRADSGRVPLTTDGRGGREQFIQACRWMWGWLEEKDKVRRNVATKVKLPARQEAGARSLDAEEFVEIYSVAVTTGQDPALDGLLLRHLLVQGVRRGGALDNTAGGLDVANTAIKYWDQKRKQWRSRPTTRTHMQDLLTHALVRGPRAAAPPDAPEELRRTGIPAIADNDALFYHPPVDEYDKNGYFLRRTTHPITRKRFESLFTRIRRHLPWADRRGLRPHDVRHTSGRLIYKASDQQMARLHLAHDSGSTTDHYLKEHLDELAKLKAMLFESPEQ
jgi:site-specific recombinase XerC